MKEEIKDVFEVCSTYEVQRQNGILKKENQELIKRLDVEIENHINSDLNYVKIIKEYVGG